MNTNSTHTYVVSLVDTNRTWHRMTIQSTDHRGVKALARKMAKAQGITVKYINDMFIYS